MLHCQSLIVVSQHQLFLSPLTPRSWGEGLKIWTQWKAGQLKTSPHSHHILSFFEAMFEPLCINLVVYIYDFVVDSRQLTVDSWKISWEWYILISRSVKSQQETFFYCLLQRKIFLKSSLTRCHCQTRINAIAIQFSGHDKWMND